jgi:hypothetical protein
MQSPGVEERQLDVVRAEEQPELGAAEDHGGRAPIAEPTDHLDERGSRLVGEDAEPELLEDGSVQEPPLGLLGHEHLQPVVLGEPLAQKRQLHRVPRPIVRRPSTRRSAPCPR